MSLDTPTLPPTAVGIAALLDLDDRHGTVSVADDRHTVGSGPHAVADLAVFLYVTLHAGNHAIFGPDALLPDVEYEATIARRTPDPGIVVPVAAPAPGSPTAPGAYRTVELHRIRLAVDDERYSVHVGTGGGAVRLPCTRPNLSPGFFMFVGDAPGRTPPRTLTRFYVRHTDPELALEDWERCVTRLAATGLSFRAKILSRRAAYPRNDALVFYAAEDAARVRDVLVEADGARPAAPGRQVGSRLTVPLAGGVTSAEDPRDTRAAYRGQSYGQHRCRVLAEAVVRAVTTAEPLGEVLAAACTAANIDPGNLARNLHAVAVDPVDGGRAAA